MIPQFRRPRIVLTIVWNRWMKQLRFSPSCKLIWVHLWGMWVHFNWEFLSHVGTPRIDNGVWGFTFDPLKSITFEAGEKNVSMSYSSPPILVWAKLSWYFCHASSHTPHSSSSVPYVWLDLLPDTAGEGETSAGHLILELSHGDRITLRNTLASVASPANFGWKQVIIAPPWWSWAITEMCWKILRLSFS
jgi:hypothetical protein